MSLAIKWGSQDTPNDPSGMLYFDAVTMYVQEFKGQVTKHPIDTGASITDHFIKDNSVYTISGVISGVDLSSIPFSIRDQEGGSVINSRQQPVSVSFNNAASGLLQYLPESIGQFLSVGLPDPVVDETVRTDLTYEILSKDLIKGLLNGLKYNSKTNKFESYIQLIELYEFDGNNIRDIIDSLVITNFKVQEDADTGDGLYFDISLEKVQFATLEKAELPTGVASAIKKNKGKQNSTPKGVDSGASDAPKNDEDRLKQIEQGTVDPSSFGLNSGPLI